MRIWSIALITATLSFGSVAQAQDEPGREPTPDNPPQTGERQTDEPQTDERRTDDDRRTRRRNRNQRRGGRNWMNRAAVPVDELKEPLGLSDEQVTKLNEINKGMREQMQSFLEKMRNGDMPDRAEMQESMRNNRKELGEKLQEILSEDQFAKFQKFREERRTRERSRWQQGGRGRDREALGNRLREDALKALELGEEAAALVTPLLDTVLETRKLIIAEKQRRRDEFKKKVRESSDPDELTKLLKDYRAAGKEDEKQLAAVQEGLREVLTLDQEAKLVGQQILD